MKKLMIVAVLSIAGLVWSEPAGQVPPGRPMDGRSAAEKPTAGRRTPQATRARSNSRTQDARAANRRRAPGGNASEEQLSQTDRKLDRISDLEDQGARGVQELARYIADPDEEVAEAAFSAWTSILEDMDVRRRAEAICAAAQAIAGSGRALPVTPGAMGAPNRPHR